MCTGRFKHMDVEELKEDEIFKQHACRVMGVIEKVVLDNFDYF